MAHRGREREKERRRGNDRERMWEGEGREEEQEGGTENKEEIEVEWEGGRELQGDRGPRKGESERIIKKGVRGRWKNREKEELKG